MPYVAVQQLLDPAKPKGMLNYWTGDFYDALPDHAVDVLVDKATRPVSPLTQIIVVAGGGAIARVDDDAMAFGQRNDDRGTSTILSMWAEAGDTEQNIGYTRELAGAMKPWSTGRVYLNFLGDEGQDRVESGFGTEKYARFGASRQVGPGQSVPSQPEHSPSDLVNRHPPRADSRGCWVSPTAGTGRADCSDIKPSESGSVAPCPVSGRRRGRRCALRLGIDHHPLAERSLQFC